MILKFFNQNGNISLEPDKFKLINITNDFRTKFLDKEYMTSDKFKFKDNIYFLRKNFFIKMGKMQNSPNVESLLIDYIKDGYNTKIIIVGDKTTIFYNNFPVIVSEYDDIDESKGLNIANGF